MITFRSYWLSDPRQAESTFWWQHMKPFSLLSYVSQYFCTVALVFSGSICYMSTPPLVPFSSFSAFRHAPLTFCLSDFIASLLECEAKSSEMSNSNTFAVSEQRTQLSITVSPMLHSPTCCTRLQLLFPPVFLLKISILSHKHAVIWCEYHETCLCGANVLSCWCWKWCVTEDSLMV